MKSRLSTPLFSVLRVVIAVGIAFLIACGIILLTSKQPWVSVQTFVLAPFADAYTMGQILKESVPLMFTGVAVSLMVRCGQFNMFVEGAFFMGALAGAVLGEKLPQLAVVTPLAAILLSGALSGAVGYIPAKLKSALGVSEFVTSLMMNFIVYWVCIYLLNNTFADPDYSSLATRTIPDTGRLPYLNADNEISSSIVLALLAVALGAAFLFRTKWGYEIRMTGDNPQFASASGIHVRRTMTYSQVIGAGIAGAGGAAFLIGNFYRFYWKALPNYGFDGFIVAIMAGNNPLLVPVVALFFGYLRTGAMEMARLTDVPNEVVYIIQAVMMILAGAQFFLQRLRQKQLRRAAIGEEAGKNA
jgi:simple sugar transport system permease protein